MKLSTATLKYFVIVFLLLSQINGMKAQMYYGYVDAMGPELLVIGQTIGVQTAIAMAEESIVNLQKPCVVKLHPGEYGGHLGIQQKGISINAYTGFSKIVGDIIIDLENSNLDTSGFPFDVELKGFQHDGNIIIMNEASVRVYNGVGSSVILDFADNFLVITHITEEKQNILYNDHGVYTYAQLAAVNKNDLKDWLGINNSKAQTILDEAAVLAGNA